MTLPRRSAFAFTAASFSRILHANERLRAGVIGTGTRGRNALLPALLELPVDITALCDVDRTRLDAAQTLLHQRNAPPPAALGDYRRLLDRKDIDIVLVATPVHWHARMTIEACEAGRDVYVEKPLAHTPAECRQIVEAARRTRRIVQVGLQQRSMKVYAEALAMLQGGVIGKVEQCETAWGYGRGVMQPPDPVTAPPETLDWEAFQGPAPRHPYQASRQLRWHHYWDYGQGPITDVGVHVMDVARWFLGLGMPLSVHTSALPALSPEQVPYVVDGVWKYERGLVTYSSRKQDMTNLFWGETGTLFVNRMLIRTETFGLRGRPNQIKEYPVDDPGVETIKLRHVRDAIVHLRNFLECVRSRQTPTAPPEVGADSTIACLLGAHSVRTGKTCRWNGEAVVDA